MRMEATRLRILGAGLLLAIAGCTTVLGTNIDTDTAIPSNAKIESIGRVKASAWHGRLLWAVASDKQLYDEVKRDALQQRGGDLLLNAKIKTTLTSYLAIFYTTGIAIEGTAAKLVTMPTALHAGELLPESKP